MSGRIVDCRKCMFFISMEKINDMDEQERRSMYSLINSWLSKHPNRRGNILGWCNAYYRPVFYYTGTCKKYAKRPPNVIPLDRFT